MDSVRLILSFVLALFAGSVSAYGTVPSGSSTTSLEWRYKAAVGDSCCGFVGPWPDNTVYATQTAACTAHLAPDFVVSFVHRPTGWNTPPTSAGQTLGGGYCYSQKNGGQTTQVNVSVVGTTITNPGICPANSAKDTLLTGSPCKCNKGFRDSPGGTCEPYSCAWAGATPMALEADVFQIKRLGGQLCVDGCAVTPGRTYEASDGRFWASGPFVHSGAGGGVGTQCEDYAGGDPRAVDAPSTPPTPPDANTDGDPRDGDNGPPSPCPTNTCPGTVNGANVCVPCKTSSVPGPQVTASAPGGAASAPPIPGAPAGAIGSTATTTCTAGQCTTTTTFYGSSGTPLGSTSTTVPDKSTSPGGTTGNGSSGGSGGGGGSGDGEGSSFGGSCAASFTCAGDAVQCAIAKQIHITNCRWLDSPTDESTAGLAALAADEARHTAGTHVRGADTEVDIGVRAAAAAVNPYAASCPANLSVSLLGQSMEIPLSSGCTLLQAMGLILVAGTVIGCSVWLVKGGV